MKTSPTEHINRQKLRRVERAISEIGLNDQIVLAGEIVKITETVESAKRYLDHLYRRDALSFDVFVAVGRVLAETSDPGMLIALADDLVEAEYDRLAHKRRRALEASLIVTTTAIQEEFWRVVDGLPECQRPTREEIELWPTIWFYGRVSKDDYNRSTSPRDQMRTTAHWCVDNHCFPAEAFHEPARSAFAKKGEQRPVLLAMLRRLTDGDVPDSFAGLVVLHTDRLARDMKLGMEIVKLLQHHQPTLGLWESDSGRKEDWETLYDLYIAKFRQAERESEIKARKIRAKYRSNLADGRVIGCYAQAYGHRVRWGSKPTRGGGRSRYQEKVVEHPVEHPILLEAAQRLLGHTDKPWQVCADFNERGMRGRDMKDFVENDDGTVEEIVVPGGEWTPNRLQSILTSPRMIGHVRYDGELWDCSGMLAPLLKTEEWKALCRLFGVDWKTGLKIDPETGLPIPQPQPAPQGRQPRTFGSSILCCEICQSPMALTTDSNGVEWYRCTKSHLRNRSKAGCDVCGERAQQDEDGRHVCRNGHAIKLTPFASGDGRRHPAILRSIGDRMLEAVTLEAHLAMDAARLAEQQAARANDISAEQRVALVEAELASLDAEDDALNLLFRKGRMTESQLDAEVAEIAAKRRAARAELGELGHGHAELQPIDPQARWQQATMLQKRQMIEEIIDKVFVAPAANLGGAGWQNREAGFRFVWQPGVNIPERLVANIAETLYRARIAERLANGTPRAAADVEDLCFDLHKQGLMLAEIKAELERRGILPPRHAATGNRSWNTSTIYGLIVRAHKRRGEEYIPNRERLPEAAREIAKMLQAQRKTYKQIASHLNLSKFRGIRRAGGQPWDEASVGRLLNPEPKPNSNGGRKPSVPEEVCLLLLDRFEAGNTAPALARWLGQTFSTLRPRTAPDAESWEWQPEQVYGLLARARRIRSAQTV